MLEKRRGAIFDLDGTLLDSMGVWRKIDEDFLGKRGFVVPPDYLAAITSKNFDTAAEYTIARFGLPESREEVIAEWFAMAQHSYAYEVKAKPYVLEYLQQLKEEGVRIAAATSSDERLFLPCLKHLGLYEYFDAFAVTAEVPRGKGFPDVYRLASERINLSPDACVVYEDILKGIEGAKMGDYYTVGVEDIHSAYEKEDIQRFADRYIVSFEELLGT